MDSPDANNSPADDKQDQPDSTDDPSPAGGQKAGNAVGDAQQSLEYWYFCSDYSTMRMP